MYRISYRFLVPGWSAKPLVSAHDRIMGTHTLLRDPQPPRSPRFRAGSLCDLAGQSEAADRIARITFCLEEMERLRDLERRMRELLPHDLEVLGILIQD